MNLDFPRAVLIQMVENLASDISARELELKEASQQMTNLLARKRKLEGAIEELRRQKAMLADKLGNDADLLEKARKAKEETFSKEATKIDREIEGARTRRRKAKGQSPHDLGGPDSRQMILSILRYNGQPMTVHSLTTEMESCGWWFNVLGMSGRQGNTRPEERSVDSTLRVLKTKFGLVEQHGKRWALTEEGKAKARDFVTDIMPCLDKAIKLRTGVPLLKVVG